MFRDAGQLSTWSICRFGQQAYCSAYNSSYQFSFRTVMTSVGIAEVAESVGTTKCLSLFASSKTVFLQSAVRKTSLESNDA
jgi:hypothetical protein